jgi:hypothetical protein
VFLLIWKRDRSLSDLTKTLKNDDYVEKLIGDHFCEDAYGRNSHGHDSKFIRNTVRFEIIIINF